MHGHGLACCPALYSQVVQELKKISEWIRIYIQQVQLGIIYCPLTLTILALIEGEDTFFFWIWDSTENKVWIQILWCNKYISILKDLGIAITNNGKWFTNIGGNGYQYLSNLMTHLSCWKKCQRWEVFLEWLLNFKSFYYSKSPSYLLMLCTLSWMVTLHNILKNISFINLLKKLLSLTFTDVVFTILNT